MQGLTNITAARRELESSNASVAQVLGEIRAQNHRWRGTASPSPSHVAV